MKHAKDLKKSDTSNSPSGKNLPLRAYNQDNSGSDYHNEIWKKNIVIKCKVAILYKHIEIKELLVNKVGSLIVHWLLAILTQIQNIKLSTSFKVDCHFCQFWGWMYLEVGQVDQIFFAYLS